LEINFVHDKVKKKVKCTLVQALRLCTGRTAHRGSRDIALLFMITALEGSEGSASRYGRSLPPGKTRYPLYRRLGGPQGRGGQVQKMSRPPGFDSRTVQPVASRYTDYATRPTYTIGLLKLESISFKWGKSHCNIAFYFGDAAI
jgi:hypothetical protein